jgi:hypothetical protein
MSPFFVRRGVAATVLTGLSSLAMAGGPAAGNLDLVTASATGAAVGGALCALSADGRLAAFTSDSGTVVRRDTNKAPDVFVKNLDTGKVVRASTSSSGAQLAGGSQCSGMTPDGRYIVFTSANAVYRKDLSTGTLVQASPAVGSVPFNTGFMGGAVSDDGNKLLFMTVPSQSYLGPYQYVNNFPARLMLREMGTGQLSTLPLDDGSVANGEVIRVGGFAVSADGSKVLFQSSSSTLVSGDTNGQWDVFVRDLASGYTRIASSGLQGQPTVPTYCCYAYYDRLRFVGNQGVLFDALAISNLGPVGTYLKDLDSHELQLLMSTAAGYGVSLSADRSQLAFQQSTGGLAQRVVLRNLLSGQDQVISTSSAGVAANATATSPVFSRDGRSVGFISSASNLVTPATPDGVQQAYLKTVTGAAVP